MISCIGYVCLLVAIHQAIAIPVGSPVEERVDHQGHQEASKFGNSYGWYSPSHQPQYPQDPYSYQSSIPLWQQEPTGPWESHENLPYHSQQTQEQIEAIRQHLLGDDDEEEEEEEGIDANADATMFEATAASSSGSGASGYSQMHTLRLKTAEELAYDDGSTSTDWKVNFPGGKASKAIERYGQLANFKERTSRKHLDKVNDQQLIVKLFDKDEDVRRAALTRIKKINARVKDTKERSPTLAFTLLGYQYGTIMTEIAAKAGKSKGWAVKLINKVFTKEMADNLLAPQTREMTIQSLIDYINTKHET